MSNIDDAKVPSEAYDKIVIAEALYRFAAGIDLKDRDLLMSAFADDAFSNFGPAAAKARSARNYSLGKQPARTP